MKSNAVNAANAVNNHPTDPRAISPLVHTLVYPMSKCICPNPPNPPKRPNDRSPMSVTGSTDECIVRVSVWFILPYYHTWTILLLRTLLQICTRTTYCHLLTRLMHCNDVTASPFPHFLHFPHFSKHHLSNYYSTLPIYLLPTYYLTYPLGSVSYSVLLYFPHHPSSHSLPLSLPLSLSHCYTPRHHYRDRYTVIQMASYSLPP
jgi:hypothetical protein